MSLETPQARPAPSLTVQTVDLDGDQISTSDATAIMANGQTVYASAQNLYVSTPGYHDAPGVDGDTPSTPRGTVPPGTIAGEPEQTTTTVVDPEQDDAPEPWEPPEETTTIHRFGIAEDGRRRSGSFDRADARRSVAHVERHRGWSRLCRSEPPQSRLPRRGGNDTGTSATSAACRQRRSPPAHGTLLRCC